MNGKKKKIIISIGAIILVFAIGIASYAATQWTKIKKTDPKKEDLEVSQTVEENLGGNYLNIALFGINIKGQEDEQVDSDAVYIASINLKTKEVGLVSVYGNTILGDGTGKTIRMKDAYAEGGAEKAIAIINKNLDLNIEKYVSVNFKAMADMVDILGGVEIDVKEEEIPHIDGYARDIAKMLGKEEVKLEQPGIQTLNGIQTVGYSRIRITEGGDVERESRHKVVIEHLLSKLLNAGFTQMDEIMDQIFPQTETNFKLDEALKYSKDAGAYKVSAMQSFPAEIKPQERKEDGDYEEKVICKDYLKDVSALHQSLFGEENYQTPNSVKEIAEILK